MPDYIVTEVVTYRVNDVADESEAEYVVESAGQSDRDTMFEEVVSRSAVDCSTPIPEPMDDLEREGALDAAIAKFGDHATAKSAVSKAFAQVEANEKASE